MPKETVARYRTEAEGHPEVWSLDEVAVVWGRDSETVQIALVSETAVEGSSQYSPPLNRHDINQTIRALRRARDQVFGADA